MVVPAAYSSLCHSLRRTLRCPASALAFAALSVGFVSPVRAEGMVTDRPDFVESSEVVGPHRVQIESGLDFDRDDAGGLRSRGRSTPLLLRIGLDERLELRVETDGALSQDVRDPATGLRVRSSGTADTALGVKWHNQEGDGDTGRPSTAWLLHVELPTGDRAFRGQGWRPSLRYVAEWDLPDEVSVGVMPGVLLDKNDSGDRFASGMFAITVGKDLPGGWHGFVELAAQQLAARRNGGNVFTFDTGVAWSVTDDLQVDASLAAGLNRNATDLVWGVGLSVRF
ncbi:transporter [Ideonella sp. YS5]|uniref:transporter n=1 Tax=Ideonella sp. YS5 TaxID=3453714 RepID=UPI003EEBE93E